MRICIVGVGNIGMRYVQGIRQTFPDTEILLIDGAARLKELAELDLGNVKLLDSLNDVRRGLDLCVVATSCEPRFKLYTQCLSLEPRYIILEKYLFKSRKEFEDSLSMDRVPTFVNQWLYGSKAFDGLFEKEVSSVELVGANWGLACNSVHWIDVFKRYMQIENLQVGSGTRVSSVFPSKRPGYEEIFGELIFEDRDSDKTFRLVDQGDERLVGKQEILVNDELYHFDFKRVIRDGAVIGEFPYLSELIGGIVGEIVDTGRCHLPALEESVRQHLLVEDILETLERRPSIT